MESTLNISMRPKTFDEVLGHSNIIAAIKYHVKPEESVPIAWMFSGPTGVGKTTMAYLLARLVQGEDFIGTPEIIEINASDTNGVDDARNLVQQAGYHPLSGKYRVVILDEAQRLTEAAQNVLLKSFENMGSTVWIICTTDPQKIIKPLRDRCLSFSFKGLSEQGITSLIIRALEKAKSSKDKIAIRKAIDTAELTLPREILMAVERYVAGLSPEEAVQNLEEQPEYFDIAKFIAAGQWSNAKTAIKQLKTSDVRGLRAVICSYLKTMLLNVDEFGTKPTYAYHRADTIAACILQLTSNSTFEDGVQMAATVACLYETCKKMRTVHLS